MTQPPLCATGCRRPSPNAMICPACMEQLEKALGDVAALTTTAHAHETYDGGLVADLRTAFLGADRIQRNTRPADLPERQPDETLDHYLDRLCHLDGPTRPERIAALRLRLHAELDAVVRQLQLIPRDGTPYLLARHDDRCDVGWTTTTRELAVTLLVEHEAIAHADNAASIHDTILSTISDCRAAIDRPADLRYLGRCYIDTDDKTGCRADLWARPGARYVYCQACGTRYRAEELRAHLLDAASAVIATAEVLSRALSLVGDQITPSMIRGYHHRRRILAVGRDHRGHPTYRLGDVRAVVDEIRARRADQQQPA